jgi:CheY-like chemotaxis protein
MRIKAKPLPFTFAFTERTSASSFLRLTPPHMNWAPLAPPRASGLSSLQQTRSGESMPRSSEMVSIYAVDDMPCLTDLYSSMLEPAGYRVKTFNDRVQALVALKADRKKPALLITDYLGLSMAADHFMHACRVLHPDLRILMASGLNPQAMRLRLAKPDRLIHKPFTPEQFRQEVRAALACDP